MNLMRELAADRRVIGALAACGVSGLVRSAALPLVTWAIQSRPDWGVLAAAGVGYAALTAVAYVTELHSALAADRVLGSRLHAFRMSLLDALRRAELRVIERERRAVGDIERDAHDLQAATQVLQGMVRAAVELLGYIAFAWFVAGPVALVLTAGLVAVGWQMQTLARTRRRAMRDAGPARAELGRAVVDLWRGMPRFILDRRAMDDAAAIAVEERHRLDDILATDDAARAETMVFNSTRPVIMCGLLTLLATHTFALGPAVVFGFVTLVFMTRGPTFSLLQWEQLLLAFEAYRRLADLRQTLADARVDLPDRTGPTFRRLALDGICFAFDGGFRLGPIDLDIRPGELVFVVGHNGSGKTTLMKVMSGLYPVRRGRIRVDGRSIGRKSLRALFTVTFADAHLFHRAYGLDATDDEIEAALDTVGLTGVVGVTDGRFDTLDLSSGQRRRLALAVALLERRPIVVLDEWDAHQDPETKRFYFERLLPDLAAQGRAVIAVCHDHRFFDVADRVIELSAGEVASRDEATPGAEH